MTNPVIIDAGSIRDLDQAVAVMNESFDPEYGEAWTVPQLSGALGLPGTRLRLARRGSDAIGFALIRTVLDESELLLIAVHPRERNSGVGTMLLVEIVDNLKQAGVTKFHLEMRDNNPAKSFYIRHGFVAVGRRQAYYRGISGRMTDAVTLSRTI